MANEKSPHMSRERMEEVIKRGGSVLYEGVTLTRIEDLPNESELAAGDPERSAMAAEDIDRKIAELQSQKDLLAKPVVDTKPEPDSKDAGKGK